jgi:hypothetical protein
MADRDSGRERLTPPARLPRRLLRWWRAARAVLVFEAVWPVFWLPAAIVALYLCAALLGLPQRLGTAANSLLLVADGLAALGALAIGIARIRWPDERDAQRRLNSASRLKHDPITTLLDSPAQMSATAHLLWQAHRMRTLAETRRLRLGLPWPWRARPTALVFRSGIIIALILCAWIAGPMATARLSAAFTVDPGALLGNPAAPPAVTAWVTPPPYTARPPVLLPKDDATLTVPRGSRLTVTVSGLRRAPQLTGLSGTFRMLDAGNFQLESRLEQSGLFTLRGRGGR